MAVTPGDFESFDWQGVIAEAEHPVCWDYARVLGQEEERAIEEGDKDRSEFYGLLRSLAALRFDFDAEEAPLPGVEEIAEKDLSVVAEVFPEIQDSELRARIGDILWLRRVGNRSFQFAAQAIDAYAEAALEAEGDYNNKPTIKRFTRAIDLAMKLGQEDRRDHIVDVLEDRIQARAPAEDTWWSRRYSELLYESELGEPDEQAQLMETAARSVEDSGRGEGVDYHTLRKYWRSAAKWHFRSGDEESAYDARREAAERCVRQAELRDSAIQRASFLEDAFEAYQDIPDSDERKEEIHRAMLEAQEESMCELMPMSTNIGNEQIMEEAQERVHEATLIHALVNFAFLRPPARVEQLEEQTRRGARRSPLQASVGGKQTNALGRVIAKKPSAFENEEEAFVFEVYKTAAFDWAFQAVNTIEPARKQIVNDHDIDEQDIHELLSDNPLVPPGREIAFTRGVTAGFSGDFLTAAHFLCVQFEESVRYLLRREGVITSGFTQDTKIQYERNLNNFLDPEHDTYRRHIVELFGQDVAFHLQALLTDERGANLRNEVAHALLPDSAYRQRAMIYFWWLLWHLIVYGSPHLVDWLEDQ